MSRKFYTVVLAGLFLLAGAACGSSNDNTDKIKAESVANCNEALGYVNTGLVAISDGVDYIASSDADTVREFLSTARSFVQTSIDTVNRCAKFDPATSSQVLNSLNDLDDAIAEVQSRY